MAETIIPTINIDQAGQLKIHNLLGDLETAFDNLRIVHDIMIDQLCEHTPADADSSMKLNERFCVLLDGVENKITQMVDMRTEISDALHSFR